MVEIGPIMVYHNMLIAADAEIHKARNSLDRSTRLYEKWKGRPDVSVKRLARVGKARSEAEKKLDHAVEWKRQVNEKIAAEPLLPAELREPGK
jgi:hypothetical protein